MNAIPREVFVAVGAVLERMSYRLEESAEASSIIPGIKSPLSFAAALASRKSNVGMPGPFTTQKCRPAVRVRCVEGSGPTFGRTVRRTPEGRIDSSDNQTSIDHIRLSSKHSIGRAHSDQSFVARPSHVSTPERILLIIGPVPSLFLKFASLPTSIGARPLFLSNS